jgi:hypothetical protein
MYNDDVEVYEQYPRGVVANKVRNGFFGGFIFGCLTAAVTFTVVVFIYGTTSW